MALIPRKLRNRLGKSHTRILRGMMLVSGFVFIGKFAGAGKEMAVAWRYGVGNVVDVYVFALVLVSWLPSVVTSVLNAVLVPLTNRLEIEQRDQFGAQLAGATVLLGLVLTLLLLFVAPPLGAYLASGFTDQAIADLSGVIRALAPAGVLMLLAALFSAQLLARERHANTLLEAAPALAILLAVLAWPASNTTYAPLIWGTLVGLLIQVLALAWLMDRGGFRPGFSWRVDHPAWRDFYRSVSTLVVGTLIMSVVPPIDQLIAARLGEGSIASLSYAMRLLALGLGLGATAVARAILPVLSEHGESIAARARLARQWFVWLLAGGVVAAAIGWFLTPLAVRLIFERGAFTAEDTLRVTGVVRFGLSQLPFYFSGIVLVQLCASLGLYRMIVYSSVLAVAVKLATGFALGAALGVRGITLSTGIMFLATAVYFFWRTKRLAHDGSDVPN